MWTVLVDVTVVVTTAVGIGVYEAVFSLVVSVVFLGAKLSKDGRGGKGWIGIDVVLI